MATKPLHLRRVEPRRPGDPIVLVSALDAAEAEHLRRRRRPHQQAAEELRLAFRAAHRRPRARRSPHFDPTPERPRSVRRHGRTRYGQARAETAARSEEARRLEGLEQLARMSRQGGKPTIAEAERDRAMLAEATRSA